jgi:hypothetical protein
VKGSSALSLAVWINEAMTAQLSAPAKRWFLARSLIGRIVSSTVSESISNAAVFEKETEPLPMAHRVSDRLGESGFSRDAREPVFQPCLHGLDQRPALGLADLGALIRRAAADARSIW